jgi:hypothetical protein
MSFPIFDYADDIDAIMRESNDPIEGLNKLMRRIGSDSIPEYLLQYVQRVLPNGADSIALHSSSTIERMKDADQDKIERTKRLFGQVTRDFPKAVHHFKIFHNGKGQARLIYKFSGNITFLKNVKNAR